MDTSNLDALIREARAWQEANPHPPPFSSVALLGTLADALETLRDERDALREAAQDLYESVQMDESVGICLSDRVPTLRLGSLLTSSRPCPTCGGGGCPSCDPHYYDFSPKENT